MVAFSLLQYFACFISVDQKTKMILIIILLMLAGVSKAIADTLAHHFETSVFKNYSRSFFDPSISWLNKYIDHDFSKGINKKVFQPFSDAWHVVNSIEICCLIAAIFIPHGNLYGFIGYVVAGIIYNLVFNLFYNKILLSKKI